MTTYTLLFVLMLSSRVYVEDTGLTLQNCAGRAAMLRSEFLNSGLMTRIGDVRYFCVNETSNSFGR
jgi:hypothetical protein